MEHQKTVSMSAKKTSRCPKLASTVIWGAGNRPLDETAIIKVIEDTVGVYCAVAVQLEKGNQVRIGIKCEDEMLEGKGLMQLSIFNLLAVLCQKLCLRILNVENQFLPDYA
ncbi:hypothetical protein [Allomuricauda sp. SCSIO 65647]|uniref:hypothetical protein n=1 Tax=Allomuricauda sp. SCSIO 65647 TaxID=2908843 RepID=UPI001F45B30C|nr:hypothetical protein [Muricauda sp. SCSIO 65647]UJH67358.1 hypothetical protein L0P89_15585 [Muricauda sp. SCSIO 65647]